MCAILLKVKRPLSPAEYKVFLEAKDHLVAEKNRIGSSLLNPPRLRDPPKTGERQNFQQGLASVINTYSKTNTYRLGSPV
jgi:hypothetical protein